MYANNDDFLGQVHRKRQEIAKSIYGSYNVHNDEQDSSEDITKSEDVLKDEEQILKEVTDKDK